MAVALTLAPRLATGSSVIEITMSGRPDGSKVWFDPYGLLIRPGQTLRWTNRDKANSHTVTAYSPGNYGRSLRIPKEAAAFDSDFLLPDESFEMTLEVPGVYDYYCIPHEMAGMVGRIIVAKLGQAGFNEYDVGDLPQAAQEAMPSIADILDHGPLRHLEG